ncbi:uncharacterized protein LOC124419343 [Lucilia cuprina]|uniref:uncharacterized protein LOC124419343 n=1 Tax=Lucilia cuprina TaxID=7375 RepID=UPI001F05BE18|nr:uncharacterized protein LOC124419343 [Lucilia cuprina]
MGGEEVATDTVYMPPTSKFDEFCIRRGINPNLIMLKITLFVMYGGFLVDKFGKYKPVVVMSLLLNAIFHHSLLFIPQQEIPGVVPSAFVMRHPDSGDIELHNTINIHICTYLHSYQGNERFCF